MNLIPRNEELILLTILKLGNEAYGVNIRERIFQETGKRWSFASIYTPLSKLSRKKYVKKIKGESSPERGGKSKYNYAITTDGFGALKEIKNTNKKFWSEVVIPNETQ